MRCCAARCSISSMLRRLSAAMPGSGQQSRKFSPERAVVYDMGRSRSTSATDPTPGRPARGLPGGRRPVGAACPCAAGARPATRARAAAARVVYLLWGPARRG